MNFKPWLLQLEAIEYQPDNWEKFNRQFYNKFKLFENKYNQEFLQDLSKQAYELEKDYCLSAEKRFYDNAVSYIDHIKYILQESYYTPSVRIKNISASNCYDVNDYLKKYNTIFIRVTDNEDHKKNYFDAYQDFLNILNTTDVADLCSQEHYDKTIKLFKTIEKLVNDFQEYVKNMQIVNQKYKTRCQVALNRDKLLPHEDFETLYHATSNLPSILSQGFKYKKELTSPTGLGGGVEDLISFTSNPNIAKVIVSALKQAVKIAKGEISSEDVIKRYKRLNLITEKDIEDQKRDYKDDKRIAFELFRLANLRRDEKGLRYDPWFGFHNFETFANTNPNDIGIIKAKIDMSKVKSYHPAEEEYRVPKEAIVFIEKY
jgi:hypothetical protein